MPAWIKDAASFAAVLSFVVAAGWFAGPTYQIDILADNEPVLVRPEMKIYASIYCVGNDYVAARYVYDPGSVFNISMNISGYADAELSNIKTARGRKFDKDPICVKHDGFSSDKSAANFVRINQLTKRTFGGFSCTKECVGHSAGFLWAQKHRTTNIFACYDSGVQSFEEGCEAYMRDKSRDPFRDDQGRAIPHR